MHLLEEEDGNRRKKLGSRKTWCVRSGFRRRRRCRCLPQARSRQNHLV